MLTLAAWMHDWDPFAIRVTETFGVRWYGLAYVAGFIAAWAILRALARRALVLITQQQVADLIFAVVLGTLVGGRLGYCLVYRPALFADFRPGFPFWGVLALTEGGMASHGGMIGITLAALWFARKHRLPGLHVMDCLALVAPVGIFFGRIANFVNGELLGRIVARPGEPAPWWAVKFPQELTEGHAPALDTDQSLRLAELASKVMKPGDDDWTALHRLVEAVQSGDAGIARDLEPLISARHPSQLYQAVAEGVVVGVALWIVFARPRRPGVISAMFFIVYGLGRIATEFIRLPDAHLAVQRYAGLSRGQWLSALMVVAGVAILLWISGRSKQPPLGGWATITSAPR
ncbi:MAG: prolipoprotein diacylglyceryl transferase [Phycisphaerae bacterium]|nr:prolipoprotein diacylglyceryl transferase [Phycisphaerae bacterium]